MIDNGKIVFEIPIVIVERFKEIIRREVKLTNRPPASLVERMTWVLDTFSNHALKQTDHLVIKE